jgi:hypothetical protein
MTANPLCGCDAALVASALFSREGSSAKTAYQTVRCGGCKLVRHLNELRTLTTDNLYLDDRQPCIVLNSVNEKNLQGSTLPLRADLAADLRAWLDDRDKPTADRNTIRMHQPTKPAKREAGGKRLFTIPAALVKILYRDLDAAGIERRDDRGRRIDVHALRGTFATMLSTSGVSPRTAQAAMRHSTINLTMNTYTDPRLLDVAGALDGLPSLSLDGGQPEPVKATGTFDVVSCAVAPTVPLTLGKPSKLVAYADNASRIAHMDSVTDTLSASAYTVNTKDPLTTGVNGSRNEPPRGLEPWTYALRKHRSTN